MRFQLNQNAFDYRRLMGRFIETFLFENIIITIENIIVAMYFYSFGSTLFYGISCFSSIYYN
jgi:hypothetical protein